MAAVVVDLFAGVVGVVGVLEGTVPSTGLSFRKLYHMTTPTQCA